MKRALILICCLLTAGLLASGPGWAAPSKKSKPAKAKKEKAQRPVPAIVRDGETEARLLEIYRLIGQAQNRQALAKAESLVSEHPNFQLAQLVYGDLLAARSRPLRHLGDVDDAAAKSGAQILSELREESGLRIRALRERPPAGAIPAQFLKLSARNRHAIAIDTSRARLYLFENTPAGLKLLSDYYISVGKSGTEKVAEGDLRTPLGVYFITSNLDPKTLKDFYGVGALPINYPNPYDAKRGKTGSGIWLHGTPPAQFSRAPKATDGCIVLANPDLNRIIGTVQVRTTPVVIADKLNWVSPQAMQAESRGFADTLAAWRNAKIAGDVSRVLGFYTPDFSGFGKTMTQWKPMLADEVVRARGRDFELKDLSYLRWTDTSDTMVVTFGEVMDGARSGPVRRQYWVRQGSQWKIFFEGVIG